MSANVKGPAIFLAQFAGDAAPFNSLNAICKWAASLGYKGVQIPTWDVRLFDLAKAAQSQTYCEEIAGIAGSHGLAITELSTHLQGQLVAVNPAFDEAFDAFAPAEVHGRPRERQKWAVDQVMMAAKASQHLGLSVSVSFTGALAWPFVYPWPQRAPGLIETAFEELARRWKPILNAYDEAGVDIAYEIHPGEDVFDGATFERFLGALKGHKRCTINYDPSHFLLQQLDYLAFIDIYHERISAFHVKDAEFNPTGRQGVYSGYASWIDRAGRFRSLGDGQVDFAGIFSKLAQYDYSSWAVLEWECCLKHPEDGAREGAEFIKSHLIRVTERAFDDFAGGAVDKKQIKRALGLRRKILGGESGMAIEGRSDAGKGGRIRLGMIGGGEGAFIGAVHRLAARMDDHYELVAGALSATAEKARRSGKALGLAADRIYDDFEAMAKAEAKRADGIEAVAVVTPNHMHAGPALAFLKAGIHVICDKPLTTSLAEAKRLKAAADKSGLVFAVTHNYTGYPLVRRAREMIKAGELGEIRLIQVEYPQDWMTGPTETTGNKQAEWRVDPKRSGAGGAIGDIGTHAYNLADYVSGIDVTELSAELTSFGAGRALDDNVQIMLRYANGARGALWASQIAPGNENGLRIRVYGTKGGLHWVQAEPNHMLWSPLGQSTRIVTRGGPDSGVAAARVTRVPPGHPEGYLEGFANIYSEVAEAIKAARVGKKPPKGVHFPTIDDGVKGLAFIEAAVKSSKANGKWTKL